MPRRKKPSPANLPTLQLQMVQADYGDCLILQAGTAGKMVHVLIDGGPDGVYAQHLKPSLQEITAQPGTPGVAGKELRFTGTVPPRLDLVVLSHIDEDHVVGLVDLMSEIAEARNRGEQPLIAVDKLWYNTFRPISDQGAVFSEPVSFTGSDQVQPFLAYLSNPAVGGALQSLAFSISQGEDLLKAAKILEIPLNTRFTNHLVSQETAPQPYELGDLKLWVIGPLLSNLERYKKDWLEWYEKHKDEPFAASAVRKARQVDKSVSNLSSIMFLAEVPGRKILLTGDGRSEDALVGLKQSGLTDSNGMLSVDVLKVPHHGSERNSSKEFFQKIPAKKYVIPAGKHKNDGNPDYQTLEWIVQAARERPGFSTGRASIDIVVANPNANTKELVRNYPPESNGYTLAFLPTDRHSILI
jgi:hypothetical protein